MPPKAGLTCRLKARGTHQIELKLHYPLQRKRRQIFETDVWVIASDRLHLTSESYGVQRVLEEVISLVRHSEPRIPLESLLDPGVRESPLARLAAIHASGETATRADQTIRELKTLVNAYRGESGTVVTDAVRAVSPPRPDLEALRRQVALLSRLPAAYRELRRNLERADLAAPVRQALAWADEGLSVVAERALFRMLDRLRATRTGRMGVPLVREALARECEYRAAAGMPLAPAAGSGREAQASNERLLQRLRALKRWSQSSLYLGRKTAREGARVAQVVAGVAAALAMTLAVVAAAFAERLFATYSLPWAFIIIFGYILKDRLKEGARRVIGALIPRWLSDRSHHLVDPVLGDAGLTRETVAFRSPAALPAEIREARARALSPAGETPGDGEPPEDVVHLRIWMRTSSARLLARHGRLARLTGIVRWAVEGWLEDMDQPYAMLRMTVEGVERRVPARHVYPVYVATRVREHGGEALHYLYRVVLSREGIVRTEAVETATP